MPPALLCATLTLRQAADAQETFGIELLEPWGKGAAKSSVAGQVSFSPLLNRASPDASSHSRPSLMMYVAADAQEIIRSELRESPGKGAAKSSVPRASLRLVYLLPTSFCLSLFISASLSLSPPPPSSLVH